MDLVRRRIVAQVIGAIASVVLGLMVLDRQAEVATTIALVRLHAGTGETDAAFSALDRAFDEHLDIVAGLKVDPVFDPLRADPRFKALLARAGL